MNCLIVFLVCVGTAVSAPAVNYKEIAKEIFTNFPIGPIHVGDINFPEKSSKFIFQDQEYELNIKDAVIRKLTSLRLHPAGVSDGRPLKTPGQHSMRIRLILGTLTMDSKLMYKKKGSSEPAKELKLVSETITDQRFITGINTVISFDVNKRKVLSIDKISKTTISYHPRSNCSEATPGFCDALHKYLRSLVIYTRIGYELGEEVKKQLTGRQY